MKRYIAIFAVALTLGGCAGTTERLAEQVFDIPAGTLTQSVTITRPMVEKTAQGLRVVVAGLRAHKRLCERAVLPPSCVDDVNRLQGYVREARPIIVRLFQFVRENDQVNARRALGEVLAIVKTLRADAIRSGVPIQVSQGVN